MAAKHTATCPRCGRLVHTTKTELTQDGLAGSYNCPECGHWFLVPIKKVPR